MTLALYRTYRPAQLSEVIGQDHVVEPLRRALADGRIHHAYLFSGPRGCGKTSTARILARSLLCEKGPTPDPCGVCDFCEALAPNGPGLVDVIELDAASHGGVDDTRDLRERAAFMPAQARFKIYIIDEAHMVSKDGFNALLKLIEEPPEHVKFIFATTEVDKVLPTIRSRTFNYTFRLVPVRQLQENLAHICEAEGVAFEPAALTLIARASGGSVRDAQSVMGQLIAGAGPAGLTQAGVAEQLGVTDDALLDAIVAAVADHDGSRLFAAVQDVVESGHDVRRFVTDLLHRFRDLLVIHHAGEGATADILDVSVDRRQVLVDQAGRFGPTELTRYAEIVNTGLTQVKGSTSPRLQLEILAARLLVPATESDPEATLARLEVLERRLAVLASAPVAPAQAVAATTPTTHVPEPVPAPPAEPEPAAEPAPKVPRAAAAEPPQSRRGRSAPPPKPTLTSLADPSADSGARTAPPPAERPAAPTPVASSASVVAERKAPTTPSNGSQAPADPAGTDAADLLARVREIWPALMQRVAQQSRVAAAAWEGADPVDVTEGTLTVRVPNPGQARSITQSRRDLALRTALIDGFRIDVTVRATSEQAPVEQADDETEPPDSDPHDEGITGVDLAIAELGATKIGEIEGS